MPKAMLGWPVFRVVVGRLWVWLVALVWQM